MSVTDSLIKTRIAPTPSGFLHLGNAMSIVVTAALVKQRGLEMLLRIDDLDSKRVRFDHIHDVFVSLEWLGVSWSKGPANEVELSDYWSQSHRIDCYNELILQLLNEGHLYPCRCSRKEIEDRGGLGSLEHKCRDKSVDPSQSDVSWRIKLPENCVIEISDESRGTLNVDLNLEMPDFVIRRRDGIPSYQVASLADDLHFGIDLIVRGEDLLESTAAQLYLAKILEKSAFGSSTFIHHPLIMAFDGGKLSKSEGADALKSMRQEGIAPDAVYSMIAERLGIRSVVYNLNSFAKEFDSQLHLRR